MRLGRDGETERVQGALVSGTYFGVLGVQPSIGTAIVNEDDQGLSRVATVGFGVDVYTAGMLATGLGVPRVPGWMSAIAGDLVWFALILATRLAAASIVDDDRVVLLAMVIAMIVIPRLARRFVPALRR